MQGIPHAYVIDWLGRVRWHGHPMAGLADKLDVLVNERKQHLAKQATGPASGGGTAASGRAQGTAANELRAKSEQQLASQSVKELMLAMKAAGIDTNGCIEKSDLIDRIKGKSAI